MVPSNWNCFKRKKPDTFRLFSFNDTKFFLMRNLCITLISNNLRPSRLCHPIQRYKFESNSQPVLRRVQCWVGLCHPIQRYKFESNSQQVSARLELMVCCVIRYKDTNLKAIHNSHRQLRERPHAVSSDTKIQI